MRRAVFIFLAWVAAQAAPVPPSAESLRRAGAAVEEFWAKLGGVTCVESVEQEKLNSGGKVVHRQQSQFDYLAVLQITGTDFLVDESRIPITEAKPSKNLSMMITRGFSTFEFVFHPFFQGSFEYSAAETAQVDGRELLQVRFQHVRGTRSPSVLRLGRREYPLDWQGVAWMEPNTGAIVRVTAGLQDGLEDLGLKSISADVRYSRVILEPGSQVHWLPSTATIEVETQGQRWRNVHTFTKYRHFSVDVKSEIGQPQ